MSVVSAEVSLEGTEPKNMLLPSDSTAKECTWKYLGNCRVVLLTSSPEDER
jgi:hypothetical protein